MVEKGKSDIYETIGSDIEFMQRFLKKQKQAGSRVELAFEISGKAGFIYDSLIDCVDQIKVVNPSKMTWIYRTSKKIAIVAAGGKLLSIMRAMMATGELFNEGLVCRQCQTETLKWPA